MTNKALKTLIVDDSPTDAYLARKIASSFFEEVQVVSHAKEMMDLLGQYKPDVICMDVVLGNWENGISLIQEIRHRDDDVSITPVIVVSSKDSEKDIAWALSKGAAAYIVKPITAEKFKDALIKACPGFVPAEILVEAPATPVSPALALEPKL